MKWLSNIFLDSARNPTPDLVEWLRGKVLSDPQATAEYTAAQLRAMGMRGVYAPQLRGGDAPRQDK